MMDITLWGTTGDMMAFKEKLSPEFKRLKQSEASH